MAIEQPTGTNLLNAPSHSKSHRVFARDGSAPDQSVKVHADGQFDVAFGTMGFGGTTRYLRYDISGTRFESNRPFRAPSLDNLYGTAGGNWDFHGTVWIGGKYVRYNSSTGKFEFEVAISNGSGEGHVVLLPSGFNSQVSGVWAINVDSSQFFGGYAHNTNHNDGDEIDWKCYLAAGTYTIKMLVVEDTDCGIVDISVDAVEVASFDTYNAGGLTRNQFHTDTGNVIASSGIKTVSAKVDGKNGSSVDYYARISSITFFRTA